MTSLQRTAILALIAALPATATAQSFDLSCYTVDGGGAMFTTGGTFELSGTIGQPDASSFAAPMTGGVFELVGGFWPVAADSQPLPCPGDLDGDRDVDLSDLAAPNPRHKRSES